jgi:hypothetical protein
MKFSPGKHWHLFAMALLVFTGSRISNIAGAAFGPTTTTFITNQIEGLNVFGHQWVVPVASDWKINLEDGAQVLSLINARGPVQGVPRRPTQFAVTDIPNYDRLTIEADVKPLGKSLMIIFAYRDEAHFNYAHLSTDMAEKNPNHNGIFHVYGGERVRISNEQGPAAFSANNRWYHMELTHDAMTGAVAVKVDGHALPALKAADLSLGPGRVGMGSFDEAAEFKNVGITTRSQ